MADLEAVLADVSYLMAMEKSKCTPAARASKKIVLPDPRYVNNCTLLVHLTYIPPFVFERLRARVNKFIVAPALTNGNPIRMSRS